MRPVGRPASDTMSQWKQKLAAATIAAIMIRFLRFLRHAAAVFGHRPEKKRRQTFGDPPEIDDEMMMLTMMMLRVMMMVMTMATMMMVLRTMTMVRP